MTDTNDNDKMLSWGDHVRSPSDLPAITLLRLAQEGFTHYLGNRVSSKITAWRKTDEGAKADDAMIEAKAESFRAEFLDKMDKGEMDVRTRVAGPKVSGFEAVLRRVALEWLTRALGAKGVKVPTGDKTVEIAGKSYTRDEAIASAVERAGKLKFDATSTIEDEAKRRHEAEGTANVEDLFA